MTETDILKKYHKALNHMKKDQWSEARESLIDLRNNSDYTSSQIESALGLSYQKSNFHGLSIYHQTKASLMDRFNSKLKQNVDLSLQAVPNEAGLKLSHPYEHAFSLNQYIRPMESLSLGILFLLICLFTRFYKRYFSKQVFFTLLIALLFFSISYFTTTASNIMVIKRESTLLKNPIASSDSLMPVQAGTRVIVIKKNNSFSQIERSGRFVGWIANKELLSLTD